MKLFDRYAEENRILRAPLTAQGLSRVEVHVKQEQ